MGRKKVISQEESPCISEQRARSPYSITDLCRLLQLRRWRTANACSIKDLHGYGERQQRRDLPDGKQVVFTRTWVDKMKDQYRSNLWIVDTEGSRPRELTQGNWRDSAPVWSPDGRRIAFISDRDTTPDTRLVGRHARGDAAHARRAHAANLRWSNDGKHIAFTMLVPDNDPILAVKLPERPRGAEWRSRPSSWTA